MQLLMEILHLMKFQKMNFLTKKMINKHPIIDYFNLVSKYNVSGGIADIEWKCNNHFLVIINYGLNFRLYRKISRASIFIYKKEKINLIALGLFGIKLSSLEIDPISIEKTIKKKKYLNNRDVFEYKSKLNKPFLRDFVTNNRVNFNTSNNLNFNLINTKFSINYNKLKFKK